jgi:replicative superfamily II helicase
VYYVAESKETPRLARDCSLSVESTSGDVPNWALPHLVVDILKNRGVARVHDWQSECLQTTGVVDGKSLVYSLPTSGGKTYVAEILLLRMVHVHRKVAIFVLPYVSIVMEKVKSLKDFGKRLAFPVEGYFQNNGKLPLPKNIPTLCVCTIEKANALVNSLIEEGRLGEVGLVVFDELHMLGDSHRGYLLEILGTKLKFASNNTIQLIGLSATLPNLQDLSTWLNGIPFYRDFRPVKLVEYVFDGYDLLTPVVVDPTQGTSQIGTPPQRSQSNPTSGEPPIATNINKPYYVAKHMGNIDFAKLSGSKSFSVVGLQPQIIFSAFHLVRQLVPHNCALVFCSSRAMTSKVAVKLANLFEECPPVNDYELSIINWSKDTETCSLREDSSNLMMPDHEFQRKMAELKDERKLLVRRISAMSPSKQINEELQYCLLYGVAWHNADLGTVERDLIETAFRQKVISAICCTSTLAAGVNLPARRVILINNKMGRDDLSVGEYRQMVGRAGRAGIDVIGESFLFVPRPSMNMTTDPVLSQHKAIKLLVQPLQAVKSTLGAPVSASDSEFTFLRRARQTLTLRAKTDPKLLILRQVDLDPHQVKHFSIPNAPIVSYFCAAYTELPAGSPQPLVDLFKRHSQVQPTGCGIDRLILDAVAGRSAVTEPEIRRFVQCTFLAATMNPDDLHVMIKRSLRLLLTLKMIDAVSPDEANLRQAQDPDYDATDPNDPNSGFRTKPRSMLRDYHKVFENQDLESATATGENSNSNLEISVFDEKARKLPKFVYIVSTFGAATYRTPFSIETSLYMREELEKALESLVLKNDLQLCWLVLPVVSMLGPDSMDDWKQILSRILPKPVSTNRHGEWDNDDQMDVDLMPPPSAASIMENQDEETFSRRIFAERVGASHDALAFDSKWQARSGAAWQPTQRFFLSLVLQEIVNEVPVATVALRYGLSHGDIENLMQLASNQAGQLVGFCKRMGWWHLEVIFKIFAVRVGAGVKEDIMPLMKIKGVKAVRARILYRAGFHSIRAIALAQDYEVAKCLSSRGSEDVTSTKLAKSIIASAQKVLDMQANELRVAALFLKDPTPTPDPVAVATAAKAAKANSRQTRSKRTAKAAKTVEPIESSPSATPARVTSQNSSLQDEVNESMRILEAFWDYDPNLSDDEDLRAIELEMAALDAQDA